LGCAARGLCHDGLSASGVNTNQGAESILAFQAAVCAMQALERAAKNAPGMERLSQIIPVSRLTAGGDERSGLAAER
jgi:hypothetical protein